MDNVMLAFQGILLIFILIGLLMGIWRGFSKSLLRVFMVIAMSLLCFFITPVISKSLINVKISGLGITISGVEFETLNQGIADLLEKIGPVGELMNASATFKAFIEAVPLMILNLVVFILLFLLLTIVSMFFSWLLAKLILHKIPKERRSRFRLLGGLVGAIQGVFVFAVVAVPVFGIVNTADKALKEIDKNTTTVNATVNMVEEKPTYQLTTTTNQKEELNIDTEKYNKYIQDFNKLPFVKVFNALKIKSLEEKVYNNLTTIKVNKEKVNLEKEVLVVARVSTKFDSLKSFKPESSQAVYDDLKFVINNLFDSDLLPRVAEEVVRYTATEWSDVSDPTAFGITKPDLGNVGNPLLSSMLTELQNVTYLSLKTDLLQTISLIKCAVDSDLYNAFTNKDMKQEDILRIIAKDEGKTLADLIDTMLPSNTLTAVLPTLIQTGFDTVYPTIGVPKDNAEKEDKIVGDLLNNFNDIYSQKGDEITMSDIITAIKDYMTKYNFNTVFPQPNGQPATDAEITAPLRIIAQYVLPELKDGTLDVARLKFIMKAQKIQHQSSSLPQDNFAILEMARWNIVTQEQLVIRNQINGEDWKTEKNIFSSIFSNMIAAYDSVKDAPKGEEFDRMDFGALGKVFDSLRHSKLLDDESESPIAVENRVAFNMVAAMLQSDLMKNINVTHSFIETIKENWDDESFKFEDAFKTLGSTVSILNKFNNKKPISAENVKDLLNGLNSSGGQMIKDMLKNEIISSGENQVLGEAIGEIVDTLASQDIKGMTDQDWKTEANALESSLNLLQQSKSEGGSLDNLTQDQIDQTVDNLLESKILYGTLIDAPEGIKTDLQKISSENQTLENALNAKQAEIEANGADQAQLEKLNNLRELFGFNK